MRILGSSAGVDDFIQIVGHISINISLESFRQHIPNKVDSEEKFILLQQFVVSGLITAWLFNFWHSEKLVLLLNDFPFGRLLILSLQCGSI